MTAKRNHLRELRMSMEDPIVMIERLESHWCKPIREAMSAKTKKQYPTADDKEDVMVP